MTTDQITLAHIEHKLWLNLWTQLLALKAITEEDLKKPQSAIDTPGCMLLSTIRTWGESLADIRKAHDPEKMNLKDALESCLDWMEFTIPRLHTTPSGSIERMNWGGPVHKARVALGLERHVSELSDVERNAP